MSISTNMWFLVFAIGCIHGYDNLALEKPTYQSHPYFSPKHESTTFDSSNAVDGLKNDLSAFGGQCVVSADKFKTATWWVNFTSIRSIHDIRIYYRTDNAEWGASNGYTSRFLGFYIYVSNTTNIEDGHLCFHDTNYTRSTIPAVVNITCPVHGQYVIYFNKRPQRILSSYSAQFYQYAHNELCEVEVYGCNKPGYYGPTCSSPCRDTNCRYCHIETGACQGCQPGYQGHQCELPCSYKFYGEACEKKCGNCSDGVTCHHINGRCANGCDVGVYGNKCKTPCPDGWHGKNCSDRCRNCDKCDRFAGQCASPCHVGWKGTTCNETCDGGMYGQNCTSRCGSCLNYKQCHHIIGSCSEGCNVGYKGELCKTECSDGTFGNNCSQNCNVNCGVPNRCMKTTGECEGGCQPGWEGLHCIDKCAGSMYGLNCSHSCGFCRGASKCHHINGSCLNGCAKGFKEINCTKRCSSDTYGFDCLDNCSNSCINNTCDPVTGYCPMIKRTTDTYVISAFGSVIGGISGLVFACIAVAILILVLKGRSLQESRRGQIQRPKFSIEGANEADVTVTDSKSQSSTKHQRSKHRDSGNRKNSKRKTKSDVADVDEDELIHSENPYGDFYANETTIRDIPLNQLESVIAEKRKDKDDGFQREYASLPYGEQYKCDEGKREENTVKNRYKTIFPYDHSRVILRIKLAFGYINANYIEGAHRQNEYIAAQGPKKNTLVDFWTMIWQENVSSIVMLTNLQEGTKIKCSQYWPDVNNKNNYGALSVKMMEEKKYAFYISRRMIVSHNEKSRSVIQYHYTAWPDYGIPDPLCLVVFLDHVNRTGTNQNSSPTVVHCSAGIGRTGTYIALDVLNQIGKKTEKVNVAEYVKKMRESRMNMVQTYEQYMTIYLALNEIFKSRVNTITLEDFTKKMAAITTDIPANQNILRKEFQSFTKSKAFIVTQYPTVEDSVDFLCLLYDQESDIVIFMDPQTTTEPKEAHTVTIVEPKSRISASGTSPDTSQLRSLVSVGLGVETENPIIVVSSDGASLCGAFCAVHNVIQQINMDANVDVFTSVRQLQVRRPEFCFRLDEYGLVNKAVNDHIERSTENIYSNQ
ncbi:uncharacterized protein LOC133174437 [Saccostrea echinata]|uniref:uncharacterized protein LOC133174437 n=1 Tax=Saccostrea echinata TaxID=191078 RepID=UPI002A7EF8DB|nr:uncharacterized protein LOC133174437 [Saccostrea echinata]